MVAWLHQFVFGPHTWSFHQFLRTVTSSRITALHHSRNSKNTALPVCHQGYQHFWRWINIPFLMFHTPFHWLPQSRFCDPKSAGLVCNFLLPPSKKKKRRKFLWSKGQWSWERLGAGKVKRVWCGAGAGAGAGGWDGLSGWRCLCPDKLFLCRTAWSEFLQMMPGGYILQAEDGKRI